MTSSQRPLGLAAAALALAALAAAPAAGDLLLTRDGRRVETRGPWQVRGPLVVFRLLDGTLASLRLDEVDLDRSAAVTAEATRAVAAGPAPAAPPSPPAVVTLTDADVAHVGDAAEAPRAPAPADEAGEAPDAETAADLAPAAPGAALNPSERLVVADWRELDEPAVDGLVIEGTVENRSADAVGQIRLVAELLGPNGEAFATEAATVRNPTLMPGQPSTFRLLFPGIYSYSDLRFTTQGAALAVGTPGGPPP